MKLTEVRRNAFAMRLNDPPAELTESGLKGIPENDEA